MEDNARHNFEKLIKDLESDVARGDVQAMKWLGDVYYQGDDKHASNLSLALKYWKMAADQRYMVLMMHQRLWFFGNFEMEC